MDIKEIGKKVNDMINCQDAEEREWQYNNVVTPALFKNYDMTYAFIKQITKEQMIELAGGMEEVVEHFNKEELADLIIERYNTLVGTDGNQVDFETMKTLKDFINLSKNN